MFRSLRFAASKCRARRPLSTLAKAGLIVTGVPAGLYLYKCLMLVLFQNKLIYLGYIPPGSRHERFTLDHAVAGLDIREETVRTSDNKRLHGLVVKKQAEQGGESGAAGPVLVYFQGNAGNMIHRLPLFDTMLSAVPGLTIFGICYRGFGSSNGRASEAGLRSDARAIVQHVQQQQQQQHTGAQRPVYIYGHSLGGAVAIDLVSQLEREGTAVAGLIVENTYTSILDMVRALYPRYTPYPMIARYFLWNHWPSLDRMQHIRTTPTLFLSSAQDEIVPAAHMQALYDAADPRHRTMVRFPRATHMDMYTVEKRMYQSALADFIKSSNG